MPAPPSPDAPGPTTGPGKAGRDVAAPAARSGLLRQSWRLLLAIAFGVPAAAAIGLAVVLHSEAGTAWLLSGLPGVHAQSTRGALLGPSFSAERLRIHLPGGRGELDIQSLQWHGARWRWWLRDGVWVGAHLDGLSARALVWRSAGPSPTPSAAPASLRLPMQLQVDRLAIDRLAVDDAPPVQELSATLILGDERGGRHRLQGLSFTWDRLRATGAVSVGTSDTMTVQAQLQARQATPTPQWQAELEVSGPLAAMQGRATLRPAGAATGGPTLDAQAELHPFDPWPLSALSIRTRQLDLSALSHRWPRTRLSGDAQVRSSGRTQPVDIELGLDNALPGPWNENRLPVRRADLDLRGAAGAQAVQIRRLDLDFGTAGHWRSAGQWDAQGLSLKGALGAVVTQALHTQAPAMTLNGPLEVRIAGLPFFVGGATTRTDPPRTVHLQGDLEGSLQGLGQTLSLSLDASAAADRLEVRRLRARAGDAQAEFGALAHKADARGWRVQSEGRLANFDPLPWVPGERGADWRRVPYRLNAGWRLDISLPAQALALPRLQLLQSLRGTGRLELLASTVAGVRVAGWTAIGQAPEAAVGERSTVEADWTLGRNRVQLRGRGDITGAGESDRWNLEVDAPALEDLAPLARLHPELAARPPESGRVRASLQAFGRWPQMRSEGTGEIERVRWGPLSARSGQATWTVDAAAAKPLEVRGELLDAAWGPSRLSALRGQVQGSWRAHQATMEVAGPWLPPAQVERSLALRPGAGTQARLALTGGWSTLGDGTARWSGTLQRLVVGVWPGDAKTSGAGDDASWLEATGLQGDMDFAEDGRLLRAQASPGRARLAGGLRLRWEEASWSQREGRQDFELRTEIEPFEVAPWLQRLRSGVRWGGDLRMAARVTLRAGERFEADVGLQRSGGDLTVSEGDVTQALGLAQAEMRLRAADGRWTFSPAFNGRTLGVVSGTVGLRTAPQARWPGPDAALDGALRVDVPDLGVWAGWLPPGWRVDGEFATTARLSGRFAAPALTGELQGRRIAVRNLLQGVSFTDGDVRVALEGDVARIERFSLRTGEGTLTVEGDAALGAQPQARLQLRAQGLRLLGRIDRQLVASGQAKLLLKPDRLQLDGRLAVDSGLFDLSSRDAPALDEDVRVRQPVEATQPPAVVASVPNALMRASQVALEVDLGERLRIKGRGLDTSLRGTVRLSTPGGRLAAQGSVRAVGGNYAAYGQRLRIERGVLDFVGRIDQPRLDILALRPNTDLRVGVSITGSADAPRVRLYSEPELGETDKLAWLVLGRGSEGLGRTDTTVLQRAAVALMAGEGEAPTDTLLRTLGIDELSLRQADGDVRETVVSLGKQLSRNWYVGYERGVNATTGTWQLIYRLAQRFTLRAQSGLENSLDLIWTWRFDEAGGPPKAPPRP